jgi:hypothetical protein
LEAPRELRLYRFAPSCSGRTHARKRSSISETALPADHEQIYATGRKHHVIQLNRCWVPLVRYDGTGRVSALPSRRSLWRSVAEEIHEMAFALLQRKANPCLCGADVTKAKTGPEFLLSLISQVSMQGKSSRFSEFANWVDWLSTESRAHQTDSKKSNVSPTW